jgi:hypothetical protein
VPTEPRKCVHADHKGDRLLPLSAFGKDSDKPDGVRIYCKICANKTQKQNQRKTEILDQLRFEISFRQGDNCFACYGPMRRAYGVDSFYASLIAVWVQYWRGERAQPRANMSPEAVVGTVEHRSLTDEVEWYMTQPRSAEASQVLRERCHDQRLICGRCWTKWHEAGGAEIKRLKWRKKPYEFPEVVLTEVEAVEWQEWERLQQEQADSDEFL